MSLIEIGVSAMKFQLQLKVQFVKALLSEIIVGIDFFGQKVLLNTNQKLSSSSQHINVAILSVLFSELKWQECFDLIPDQANQTE